MSARRSAPSTESQVQPISSLSPEVFAQIVNNQTKELEFKQKEMAIAEHSNEMQFSFANKQLEAQERDRQDERRNNGRLFVYGLGTVAFVVTVACCFFAYCISQGKSEIVVELFKVLCYGGSFGTGGFAWGRYRGKSESERK